MTWSLKPKNAEATETLKTKNAVAVSTLETKIPQQGGELEILTPDYQQVLVGVAEDQVLIYDAGFNNWDLKDKIL